MKRLKLIVTFLIFTAGLASGSFNPRLAQAADKEQVIERPIEQGSERELKFRGNEGPHGGDTYALEFVSYANELISELKRGEHLSLVQVSDLDVERLILSIKHAKVYSDEGEEVNIGGQEVDAINYPASTSSQEKIILNRSRWRMATIESKLKLVLHEYFGLIGLERDTYNASIKFKHFLFSISQKLMRDQNSIIRYYGYGTGSPPLYSVGETCSPENQSVSAATAYSKTVAKDRCMAEQKRDCKIIHTEVKTIRSAKHLGFEYCEVTSIALSN